MTLRSRLCYETIPKASFRQKIFVADFFSQGDDEVVDRSIVSIVIITPTASQSLHTRYDWSFMFQKKLEELTFLCRQYDRLAISGREKLSCFPLIDKSTEGLVTSGASAEMASHASEQFLEVKGFCDIVVRAKIKTAH